MTERIVKMDSPDLVWCSFCGKGQCECEMLIQAGERLLICAECVGICNEIFAEWLDKRAEEARVKAEAAKPGAPK